MLKIKLTTKNLVNEPFINRFVMEQEFCIIERMEHYLLKLAFIIMKATYTPTSYYYDIDANSVHYHEHKIKSKFMSTIENFVSKRTAFK